MLRLSDFFLQSCDFSGLFDIDGKHYDCQSNAYAVRVVA